MFFLIDSGCLGSSALYRQKRGEAVEQVACWRRVDEIDFLRIYIFR